jgi:hypothetical protein
MFSTGVAGGIRMWGEIRFGQNALAGFPRADYPSHSQRNHLEIRLPRVRPFTISLARLHFAVFLA